MACVQSAADSVTLTDIVPLRGKTIAAIIMARQSTLLRIRETCHSRGRVWRETSVLHKRQGVM
jgi:hypothetical protein